MALALQGAPGLCEPPSYCPTDLSAVLDRLCDRPVESLVRDQRSSLDWLRGAAFEASQETRRLLLGASPSVASVLRAASPGVG